MLYVSILGNAKKLSHALSAFGQPFFFRGAELPGPQNLLEGGGKQVRHIVLESAADLDKPAVKALMARALERSANPLDSASRGRIIIKSISARQRPRRPA
jgi:hypothetical protein